MLGAEPRRGHDRLRGLDLAPLYQECLLQSRVRRETYDAIATELCDYGLEWGGAMVDARAYRCRAGGLSIYSMRYGDEVRIRPDLYRDFVLAHISVRKGIEIETDGRLVGVPEGRVFFSAPRHSIALRWQEGCEQVLIRIPHAILAPGEELRLSRTGAELPAALTAPFVHQLSAVLALARQPTEPQGLSEWQAAMQDGLTRIVAQSLGLAPPRPLRGALPQEPRGSDRRDRLESFVAAHLDRPIQLADMERAAGLGHSQLNALTQDSFGCTPMALVRRMRLAAVRQSLEARPDQDLTQLSLRYGFDHQGRFAQYYRQEFGEVPSATRRRLRGQAPTGRNG